MKKHYSHNIKCFLDDGWFIPWKTSASKSPILINNLKCEGLIENRYFKIGESCNNKNFPAFAVCIKASFVSSFSSCTTIIINVHFSFIQWEMILSYFHSYNFQKVVFNSETHGQYRILNLFFNISIISKSPSQSIFTSLGTK